MGKFHNQELESAYEHFKSAKEVDCSQEREDIEQLEKVLRKNEVASFRKEYEGIGLSWDKESCHLVCEVEGSKTRLKDHKPQLVKKISSFLPDFFRSLSEQK